MNGVDDAIHTTPKTETAAAEGAPKESAFKRMGDQIKCGWAKFSDACKKGWNDLSSKLNKEKPASSEQVAEVKEDVQEVKEEVKDAAAA